MKICKTCLRPKEISEFGKSTGFKSGINSNCKICHNAKAKAWADANRDKTRASTKKWKDHNPEKVNEYNIINRDRHTELARDWRIANPEKSKEASNKWKRNNPEKSRAITREWEAENADYLKLKRDQYYWENKQDIYSKVKAKRQANPADVNARNAKRRAAKLHRTPRWLTAEDWQRIKQFYIQAAKLSKETGIPHEVDHIIPLQGETVSGFHHPDNLQILTESENCSKKNKY